MEEYLKNPNRTIYFLPDKRLSEEQLKIYEELLENKINQDNIIYLRVWQGCGTVNCHTIPIHKDSEINNTINQIFEISEMVINKIKKDYKNPVSLIRDDWKIEGENQLKESNPLYVKIYTLVGLALIYKKNVYELNFDLGKLIYKIIELNESYRIDHEEKKKI